MDLHHEEQADRVVQHKDKEEETLEESHCFFIDHIGDHISYCTGQCLNTYHTSKYCSCKNNKNRNNLNKI